MFAKSAYGVPLLVIKTAGLAASPWTRYLPRGVNALRTAKYHGLANLHDWDSSQIQLDSMMRAAKLRDEDRLDLLAKATLARTEPERQQMIARVESAAVRRLAERHQEQFPGEEISPRFIEELMTRGQKDRGARLTASRARAFAATPDARVDDAALTGRVGQSAVDEASGVARKTGTQWQMRVDQVNDDGVPVSLPVLETQLANVVPMIDIDLAEKVLSREGSRMSRLAKAWESERHEIERLSRLKAPAGSALDKALQARRAAADSLVDAASTANRMWKFSVLFRLGYPMRVVLDDHMRIWSQVNAMSFYGDNSAEAVKNLGYNLVGRHRETALAASTMRYQRREYLDQAEAAETAGYDGMLKESRSMHRSIQQKRRALARWREELSAGGDELKQARASAPPLYHGTRERFPNDRPGDIYSTGSGARNLYGHGFYTTDAADVARTYTRKGGETERRVVYGARWKGEGEPNMLDLDDGVDPIVHQWGRQQADLIDDPEVFWAEATDDAYDELARALEGGNSGEVIRAVRSAYGSTGEIPSSQIDEMVGMLSEDLADAGFDGLRHVGGTVTNSKKHNVSIFFNPQKLDLSEFDDAAAKVAARQEELGKKIRDAEAYIADKEAAMYHLIDELPDQSPAELRKQADELTRQLDSVKAGDKRHIGQRGFSLNGVHYDGAFATPTGAAYREGTRSQATYDAVIKGSEETTYHGVSKRAHRIIQPTEPGHIDAWASAVNFQFRQSAVAMHFIEGGDVKSFVKWLNKPEQKHLRDRVPHFAHDPEDWGHRVQQLVDDYLPTQGLREAAAKGEVRGKQFRKEVPEGLGPAVHGAVVADNLGTSGPVLLAGKALNRAMRWLAETPTDRLARHPYFNSMYKQYVKENHELVAIAKRKQAVDGKVQFTEADRQLVMKQARASALTDLKRTLFDISAHSNAAHAMRFLSPFFAAHQESLARWWRIVADDPSVIRRFQQAFDMPRKLELVYDYETGELVESGEGISTNHRLLLQVPHAWGGRKIETVEVTDEDGTTRKVIADPEAFSKWSLGENSFNIVLQGGLMNPGAGPLVSLPTEFLAAKYANEEEITRVARVFNPFPPQQPTDVLWPATAKRFIAAIQKDGNKEYNARYNQNLQDTTTKFLLENGREPSESEAEELMLRAGRETNVDMWLRFANNALSPMPASPGSRYQAVTHGWRQIMDLSQDKGYGFEWALEKFKERYGEAYMPLVYSTSNNPAGVDITAGAVGSYKRHKPLLEKVDHRLHRGVMGADGKGEYTAEARAFFMNQRMRSGSADTYLSNDEPRAAHLEHMVKRGWDKYSAMSAQLEVLAEEFGLASYRDSEVLTEARREAVEALKAENYAWGEEWDSFNPNEFNTILDDLNRVAFESDLGKDTLRGDVRVLQDYLASRDAVVQIMEERRAAGLTFSPDAKDMQPVMSEFTRYVGELVESNTEFHEYWFDGLLERDPLLTGELE